MNASITRLDQLLAGLPDEDRRRFDGLFQIVFSSGELRVPPEMRRWVTRQFGSLPAPGALDERHHHGQARR